MKEHGGTEAARNGQRVLVIVGGHAGFGQKIGEVDFGKQSLIDVDDLQLRWYDYLLKGIHNGMESEKPVKIFVMGVNKWREEDSWPLARARSTKYYLHSGGKAASLTGGGSISTEAPRAEPSDRYTYDPGNPAAGGYLKLIEKSGPSFNVQVSAVPVSSGAEIDRAFEILPEGQNVGLILLPCPVGANNRDRIIGLAARRRLPAVYPFRYHVISGGLVSYGVDNVDLYRRAASYVDRILKGEKPADMPVQAPTKYELVINLATAKALGLDVPPSLLARADEVIE